MEKDRSSKVIAVVALLVGVVGLSLGFAAFSSTLTIKPSATVTPNASTFNVDFSSVQTAVEANAIKPTLNPTTLTASDATINNVSDPVISNLAVEFTAPGQSATYTFYAYNAGEYDAFLNSIAFGNAADATTPKKCVAGENANDSLVQAACADISVSVKVGTESATSASIATISDHTLAKGTGEEVVVTIEYAENGARADGPFTVNFGDITLAYGSVD